MSDQLLQEILNELKTTKQERQGLKAQMNNRLDTLDAKMYVMERDIKDIQTSVKCIEENEPQDIVL